MKVGLAVAEKFSYSFWKYYAGFSTAEVGITDPAEKELAEVMRFLHVLFNTLPAAIQTKVYKRLRFL